MKAKQMAAQNRSNLLTAHTVRTYKHNKDQGRTPTPRSQKKDPHSPTIPQDI